MAAEKISAGKTQACSSLSGLLNLVLCAHAFEREGMWLLVLSHLGNLQSVSLVGFNHKRSWQRMQRKQLPFLEPLYWRGVLGKVGGGQLAGVTDSQMD